MPVARKAVHVVGVNNELLRTALGKAGSAATEVAGRINQLGGPVKDVTYDAHYNGRVQQAADQVTSAKELTKLAGAATDKDVTLDQARDLFKHGGLPFLNQTEAQGAAFLSNIVGDIELATPAAPKFEPKLELPLPERKETYTRAQAEKLLAEKFPTGVISPTAQQTVKNVTLKVEQRGDTLGRVKISELLGRLFKDDANAELTPKSLRFTHLVGDPYAKSSDPVSKGGALLSPAEKAAAQLIYAALFIPGRSPDLPSPEPVKTPIAKFKGIEVYMESKTAFSVGYDGDNVEASTRHAVIVKAPPGTTLLYGEGLEATLERTHVVGKEGQLELKNYDNKPFAARLLVNKDPAGILSPTLAGSFAVQLPTDERRYLRDD